MPKKKTSLDSRSKGKQNRMKGLSNVAVGSANRAKRELQIRTYWRGGTYKKILHFSILAITALFVVSGLTSRVAEVSSVKVLGENYNVSANVDTLQQGVGIETTPTKSPLLNFKISNYTVKDGDSLQSIADQFSVSKETVQWANSSKINYFDEKVKVGDSLMIPEITGVLYEVRDGDTIDSVVSKTSGNRFEVIEINQLQGPEFTLAVGSKVLIPNGKLPPPPPPAPKIPVFSYRNPTNVGQNINFNLDYAKLKDIAFVNPLSNPACAGYTWSRGFAPWHNGIDLAKGGGCPIRAAAAGTVVFAGWSYYGEGFNVRIDHGNGVQTSYYHGETVWAQVGQNVAAGQEIMYMGSTGNSTGTHLHLGIKLDGVFIDASPYIPY